MTVSIIVQLATLMVALLLPNVAYPFSMVLRKGRQAIDDLLTWKGGSEADHKEKVEDAVTHGLAFLLATVVWAGAGYIFIWYVRYIAGLFGPRVAAVLYNPLAPALYWTIMFAAAFCSGWTHRRQSGHEH